MGSPHLFSELFVSTVFDCIYFESVGVAVDVMVLGEHVGDWIDGCNYTEQHVDNDLGVWNLVSSDESKVFRNIMGHLWSGGWGSIVVLNHTIMELWWHSNNHMIEVWVEMSTFWNIKSKWWVVMVSSKEVVGVVDQTWGVSKNLGKIWWPDTHVGLLGLMDSHVWSPHSVMNNSLSEVPFLEEVTLVFLMTWMDFWKVLHLVHEFSLLETLINEEIVLLMHSTVTSLTSSLEDFETSSKSLRVISVPSNLRWPVRMAMVHTDGVDLFFITLDTVWSTDIISEEPGLGN